MAQLGSALFGDTTTVPYIEQDSILFLSIALYTRNRVLLFIAILVWD